MTPRVQPLRAAWAIPWARRSWKSVRFGRFVNGSKCARRARRSVASRCRCSRLSRSSPWEISADHLAQELRDLRVEIIGDLRLQHENADHFPAGHQGQRRERAHVVLLMALPPQCIDRIVQRVVADDDAAFAQGRPHDAATFGQAGIGGKQWHFEVGAFIVGREPHVAVRIEQADPGDDEAAVLLRDAAHAFEERLTVRGAHAQGARLAQRAVEAIQPQDLRFRLLACGDVAQKAGEKRRFGVRYPLHHELDRNRRPVPAQRDRLDAPVEHLLLSVGEQPFHAGLVALAQPRRDQHLHEPAAYHLGAAVAERPSRPSG